MDREKNIKQAAEILRDADAVLITAGAGMGVDSGLPDFRGNKGFWVAYPPIARLGISFVEMANPTWFLRDPELAWAFYGHRLNLYRSTVPHEGFSQLLHLGNGKEGGYFVFTSNVDGQFQKAGFDDNRIEECHGSIHFFQCSEPCSHEIWAAKDIPVQVDMESFKALEPMPRCVKCGNIARPNVLMFGDWNWIGYRADIQSRRLSSWLANIQANSYKLAIVETGAGTALPTVRYKSEYAADGYNGTLIRINPRDYHVPPGNIAIPLRAAEGISRIFSNMAG